MVQEMPIFQRILNIRIEYLNGSMSTLDIQRKNNLLMHGLNGQQVTKNHNHGINAIIIWHQNSLFM